jgi:hypothetical protein
LKNGKKEVSMSPSHPSHKPGAARRSRENGRLLAKAFNKKHSSTVTAETSAVTAEKGEGKEKKGLLGKILGYFFD